MWPAAWGSDHDQRHLSGQGLAYHCGVPPLKDHIPDSDAVAVQLLKEAGAIIIGRTNTPTLAMDMQTDNPIFGKTNNPWDVQRTPAGPSGGCATALATGMTSLSLGSDLAGSIRLPASFCGVYGLKPTHGVVSFEGHIVPLPGEINGYRTLAVAGPLARSIADLALALDVLTKPTSSDRNVAPLPADLGEDVDVSKRVPPSTTLSRKDWTTTASGRPGVVSWGHKPTTACRT
jgi:amidase